MKNMYHCIGLEKGLHKFKKKIGGNIVFEKH